MGSIGVSCSVRYKLSFEIESSGKFKMNKVSPVTLSHRPDRNG
jgi:hypothetical protein